MELPGATVAPEVATTPPTVPVPPRLAPDPTVTIEPARLPLTESRPCATPVAPVKLPVPVRSSVPAPVLVRVPEPEIGLAMPASPA
ncbi:hypothetical protein CHKEEEPN_0126 [Methylorubrum podarium]|nr:hypothetical protein CHKEEEPN_0126 [Methylorubrum podarium]